MLTELRIKNYLLIESLTLRLTSGLNVLTGETGAGKSILLGSISFLLGEKVNSSVLRKGAETAQVSGLFDLSKNKRARKLLEELSLLEGDEENLIVRREIDSKGKSRSFINDQMVNLSTLVSVGDLLLDIHGQHDHQLLLKSSEQRDLLDAYSGNEELLKKVAQSYADWKELKLQLDSSQISDREREQKVDLFRYQVTEIEAAKLEVGEEDELEKLLPQLKNGDKLRKAADEFYGLLYESEGSVLEKLGKANQLLESMKSFGVDLEVEKVEMEEVIVKLKRSLDSIQGLRDGAKSDPQKLDELYARQDLISKLKKKYGATLEEILAYKEKIGSELENLENYSGNRMELEKNLAETYSRLIKESKKLSGIREKAAQVLSLAVQKELKDLGFQKCGFEVNLEIQKDELEKEIPSPTGLEKCEFLFNANPGEKLKPLKEIASGGELSRVMLALKKILAKVDPVSTLIFDEIDAGVGGSIAYSVGEKLKGLSRSHQVLMITHLPQIAAFAENHISVKKKVSAGSTEVTIELLEDQKRVREVARMLGGVVKESEEPTSVSLKHATELLERYRGVISI